VPAEGLTLLSGLACEADRIGGEKREAVVTVALLLRQAHVESGRRSVAKALTIAWINLRVLDGSEPFRRRDRKHEPSPNRGMPRRVTGRCDSRPGSAEFSWCSRHRRHGNRELRIDVIER
jgi:hypothetical protein